MKAVWMSSGVALTALMVGCSAPAPSTLSYSLLALPGVSRTDAYNAARRAMAERYRIAESDVNTGLLRGAPVESRETGNQMRVSDLVGVPRLMRTVATTRVTGSDADAEVWCKVVVQRYESQAARLFRQDLNIDDTPIGTAADRDASTTPEQNAVWRTDHRDKQIESDLLRTVLELVNAERPPAKTEDTAAASPVTRL